MANLPYETRSDGKRNPYATAKRQYDRPGRFKAVETESPLTRSSNDNTVFLNEDGVEFVLSGKRFVERSSVEAPKTSPIVKSSEMTRREVRYDNASFFGDFHMMAININKAIIAGGALAYKALSNAYEWGSAIDKIETILRKLSSQKIYNIIASGWYQHAKNGLYDSRIERMHYDMQSQYDRTVAMNEVSGKHGKGMSADNFVKDIVEVDTVYGAQNEPAQTYYSSKQQPYKRALRGEVILARETRLVMLGNSLSVSYIPIHVRGYCSYMVYALREWKKHSLAVP
tara:strand:+ start:592 stop:1446 length:855 start_codon:yes stop_codon:yes gene_type:complete